VREFFGDAAVVHDKRGSNAALLAMFFVVINLDDPHATSVRHGDCVAVADRVAVVSDDPDLTASHVDQAEACHATISTFSIPTSGDSSSSNGTTSRTRKRLPFPKDLVAVFDLLVAVPKIGPVKANHLLTIARISPSKTVGALSGRQCARLIELLNR